MPQMEDHPIELRLAGHRPLAPACDGRMGVHRPASPLLWPRSHHTGHSTSLKYERSTF
jgi:hypothetical protein